MRALDIIAALALAAGFGAACALPYPYSALALVPGLIAGLFTIGR